MQSYISAIKRKNEKALSVFLTAGYPEKEKFTDLAKGVLDSGADLLELGIPFSDPAADGAVIQYSSQKAIEAGINIKQVLKFTEEIKSARSQPVILMGYANPILNYGTASFFRDAKNAGAQGIIVPDVPLEEYESFFGRDNLLDTIMLVTPTSTDERINKIDQLSKGFVYCVSTAGTTGVQGNFKDSTLRSLERIRKIVTKDMLVGFGISGPDNIRQVSPFCDGVIVGSAVIRQLTECKDMGDYAPAFRFISSLKEACLF